jgi:predicted dehydrogenase (TIGR03970 family)
LSKAASHSDVLIVGAGSAGSVVAERLSVDPSRAVTVLESGPALTDPALLAATANGFQLPIGAGSPLVRRYQTRLTDDPVRLLPIVRGTTVGGSGAVNGGYFCRAEPRDFDRLSIPGWAWSDVLDSYRAIETDLDFDGPVHGDHGPIPVLRTHEMVGITECFIEAAHRVGFEWIADLNDIGPQPVSGIGAVPLNIVDGVRIGSGAGFLMPALGRANLTLRARTRAVRVRFAGSTAVGVDAIGPEGPASFTADRIVLSGGAIQSAHLLMLSGVGEQDMLRGLGVPVVAPLPVGTSFSDHPEWLLPTDWTVVPGRPVLEVVLTTEDLEIRPYTSGFVAMTGDGTEGRPDWPHLGVALMRPRSRGRLTLVSPDPGVPPRIEHRYDSEPDDVAALREGSELARELTGAAAGVGLPAWSTSQHLCGTAPMGADGRPRAVVDHRCRVHGFDNLWVIDGSILPAITSRGPHATIVMLGHRAAEFVR